MTIAIVQSVTAVFSSSTSATATLTGVTAGNDIIVVVNHGDFGSAGGATTVSDGTSYTQDDGFLLASAYFSGIFSLDSVSAGTHAVVATCSAGTGANSYGAICAYEVSGLTASPLDQATTPGHSLSSTTPAVGPSGTLAQANEIIFTAVISSGTTTGITWPPTGGPGAFTSDYNNLASTLNAIAHQIQTVGTSALTVSAGTMNSAQGWVMPLATYKGAAGVASLPIGSIYT